MADFSLTPLQLEIMNILWDKGEATAVDVREALQPARDLAQTTVATLLSRLKKRGVVRHRTEGRQYVYRPAVEAYRVQRSIVSDLTEMTDRVFAGDVAEVVNHLLLASDVDAHDLARVRRMVEERESELQGKEGRL